MDFYRIAVDSADWTYRPEPSAGDQRDILWLTPTVEATERVRAALAEIDELREAADKAAAEAKKAATESTEQEAKPRDTANPAKE
jgi:hypothetical protein